MRLYLIRHADPDYPNKTITQAGHAEAKALAPRLEAERIDTIYCSPMGRAQHTAAYTAERLGLKPITQPWMQEMMNLRMADGEQSGMMSWDLHGHVLRTDVTFARRGNWWELPPLDRPEYRQAVEELARQSDRFFEELGYRRENGRYRVLAANQRRIALFCHNGLGLTWLSHLLEIPLPLVWSGFWLPASSVTVVLFDQRNDTWAVPRCLCVGDTSHLYAAGLPIQPAGIKGNFD